MNTTQILLSVIVIIFLMKLLIRRKPTFSVPTKNIIIITYSQNYSSLPRTLTSIYRQNYQNWFLYTIIDSKDTELKEKVNALANYWGMLDRTHILDLDNADWTMIKHHEEDIILFLRDQDWLDNDYSLLQMTTFFDDPSIEWLVTRRHKIYNSDNDVKYIIMKNRSLLPFMKEVEGSNLYQPLVAGYSYLFDDLKLSNEVDGKTILAHVAARSSNVKMISSIIHVSNNENDRVENGREVLRNGKYRLFDKVFLINLKKRVDRNLFSRYKLRNVDLQVVLWTAEDGYTPENISLFNEYKKNLKGERQYINSAGALGLLLTYKKLIQYCKEKKYKSVCILEDDFYFIKNFMQELKRHEKLGCFKDYNIVYLGANQYKYSPEQESEMKKETYYNVSPNPAYCTYGTYGLVLSEYTINVLFVALQDITKVDKPIDYLLWTLQNEDPNLRGIVLYPNIVIPEVRESDNMGKRDLVSFASVRGWNLENYEYVELFEDFYHYFDKIYVKNNYSIRQHPKSQINWLSHQKSINLIEGNNTTFVFIIPSYNNVDWLERNLKSVIKQDYPLWRIIYIDDFSSDATYEMVLNFIKANNLSDKIILLKNNNRKYQAYSRYQGYMSCDDGEVCCFLDGDDWLYDTTVLSHLNTLYKSGYNCTYGRFVYYENRFISTPAGTKDFPRDIVEKRSYRQYPWISQHLRTMRASLIKSIPTDHLKDHNGQWLKCCTDLAEMFWVLEKSGGRHINSGKVMYVYNRENSKVHEYSYYRDDNKEYRNIVEKLIRSR